MTTKNQTSDKKLSDLISSFNMPHVNFKDDLSYKQILALANGFLGWAMAPETEPLQAMKLCGQARALFQLADLVGESWNPPPPDPVPALTFMANMFLESEA